MAKVITEPLSGMRDFLPLDVLRRNYVIYVIKRVYQQYSFEPLETPTMERLSTLLGKYGDEGDQLIFRVLKRGDKLDKALADQPTENSVADAGMRYDLTVPLARVMAEYRSKLPRYFKRYQIQPVYRADRPAKGRFRELYQCDVDIVGSKSQMAEAEVLAAGAQVLEELGFHGRESFALRLNHRGILRGLMETSGVPIELEGDAFVAIDKLDKIGIDGVRRELSERGIAESAAESLLSMLQTAPAENAAALTWLGHVLSDSESGSKGVAELQAVVRYSEGGPAADYLRIDPYLARGLSYYTGPIFEIKFPDLSGSGGGGGRYDDLIGMFSGQTIPACGFSLGLERILLIMEERGHVPGAPGRPATGAGHAVRRDYCQCLLPPCYRTEGRRLACRPLPRPGPLRQTVQVRRRAQHPLRCPRHPPRSRGRRGRRQRSHHRRTGRPAHPNRCRVAAGARVIKRG